MTERAVILPTAAEYLPDWTARRFVVLERSRRWAPAIATELNTFAGPALSRTLFESCSTAREAGHFLSLKNTVGVVLLLDGMERDCLGLLGRMARTNCVLPVLAVGTERHKDLTSVLMESGVQCVLLNIRDDVPVANWCRRVVECFAD